MTQSHVPGTPTLDSMAQGHSSFGGNSPQVQVTVAVTTEQRLQFGPDGECYGGIAGTQVHQWRHMARVFGSVNVLARTVKVSKPSGPLVTTRGIRVINVPPYQGVLRYIRHRREAITCAREALEGVAVLIAVVPGNLGNLAIKESRKRGIPYAVTVVGDPWEVFAKGASRHPLRVVLRHAFSAGLRRQCSEALAVRYVTEETLQRRYPPPDQALSAAYSNVSLSSNAFITERRECRSRKPLRLINVAMHEQPYKGIQILFHALAELQGQLPCNLRLIGEGRLSPHLRRLAGDLGVLDNVIFTGSVGSASEIRRYLDDSDLFVLPSLTEGLPRALIEAMARGLPCLASDVGGIREILPPEALVRAGSSHNLAQKVFEVANDAARLEHMSVNNLARSLAFHEDALDAKALAYLEGVRSMVARRG